MTGKSDFKDTALGIELGSTRIKAVLIDSAHRPIASGSFGWENELCDGIWTYSYGSVADGVRACYADLKRDVYEKYGVKLTEVGAIGVSGMMHGYLPLDREGTPLVPFRTWRNTVTGDAARELTGLFGFSIPQRWSVAHLRRAVTLGEDHVSGIDRITTLAGYIHFLLTGKNVLGVGEASGMFPIDPATHDYDEKMLSAFDRLSEGSALGRGIRELLPEVLTAGEPAGELTPKGALFLDPEGDLRPGIPFAPPEGDAGTGMTATNSVAPRTGNVSAGTSDFAMIVTDKPVGVHREIDMVTTPDGSPVAMVHCNNCTSDINAWTGLFGELLSAAGSEMPRDELFGLLFNRALEGEPDCGGLVNYNYFSGEGVTDLDAGRPLFVRRPESRLTLANFMRVQLLSSLATLKIGLDLLTREEKIPIDRLYAHGGLFRTRGVGQRMLSAAVGAPVSVMETAGEGGPYGMALLASYMLRRSEGETLAGFLAEKVFANAKTETVTADESDVRGFAEFLERYKKGLPLERAAVDLI